MGKGQSFKKGSLIWAGLEAHFPEVRDYLLEVAETAGGKALREQCEEPEPLYLLTLGEAAADKLLPKALRVSGAGDDDCNGEYRLEADRVKSRFKQPIWKKVDSSCIIGRSGP